MSLRPQVARASGKKWGHSSFPSKRGQTCSRSVPFCPRSGEMRNVPISFLAAARRKPTGLDVCKNGCAGMNRGGPYWLPPRRAPFGRKENPPQAGVPPDSASPRSLVTVCEEARDSMGGGQNHEVRTLRSSSPLGHMPRWLSDGNGAAGRDGGGVDCSLRERAWRAASERRPARSSSLVVLP